MNLPASSTTPWFVGPRDTMWLAWNSLTCHDCPGLLVKKKLLHRQIYGVVSPCRQAPSVLAMILCKVAERDAYTTMGLS